MRRENQRYGESENTSPTGGSDDSDLTLANEAARGDGDAFTILWERHEGRLRRRISGRLAVHVRRVWPVADVLQEVCIAAWNCLQKTWFHATRTVHSFRHLVNSISRHKELDTLRKFFRRTPPTMLPDDLAAQSDDPERQTIGEELRTLLATLVQRLPEGQRSVYALVLEQDQSCFETSKLLDVSARTVQRRLFAAKQRLIRWLGEAY